jgi:hypothetical protein
VSPDPSKLTPAAPAAAAAGGFLPWLPWIGAVIVVGAVGAAAGALGAFGTPEPAKASSAIVLGTGIDALDCPAGAPVAHLVGGERVLALKRSDDSHYVQVRDPYDINQLVWLSAGIVSIDKHEPAIGTLAVAGCPKPTMALDALPVAPVVPTAPTPGKPGHVTPPAPPAPPKETVKPIIIKASANPTTVYNDGATTLSVVASDNVGVTGVTATWSGSATGSAALHLVGGTWQMSFSSSRTDGPSYGNITFTLVAHDAAGNASTGANVVVQRQFFG